jgi:uncharacterized protein YjbI with pentapeptide repeats
MGAVLEDLDLSGANLGSANLLNATLANITYDRFTIWPENIDADKTGTRMGWRELETF